MRGFESNGIAQDRLLAMLLALVVSLTGCQPAVPTPQAPSLADELRIATASFGTEVLDPMRGPSDNERYRSLMFDPLVGVDFKGVKLSKDTGIARDWAISADGKTYTFTVRQGVKFHNGDELTAEDVKFTLDRVFGPDMNTSKGAEIAGSIERVTVTGPYEVEVRLKQPKATFLLLMSPLADGASAVVPKKYFEVVGKDEFGQKPIGSGPYKLVEHQTGALMRFEQAFPEHWAIGKPRFAKVTLRLVTEESTRLAMLRAGDADFADVGTASVAALKKDGFKIFQHGGPSILYALFQLQRPGEETRDLNLRKALSYSINREEINNTLLGGAGQVTGNIFPGLLGGQPLQPDPYDPQKAKDFLNQTEFREAGKKLTLQMQVMPREGWPQMQTIAAALQDYWKRIGVATAITNRDFGVVRADWAAGKLPAPAVILINFDAQADWAGAARLIWTCRGALSSACDPELDKLANDWAAAPTQEDYVQRAAPVERYMRENYVVLPIVTVGQFFVGNDQISNEYSPGLITRSFNVRGLVSNSRP
jgi:peptide/nickel transport system substrate-binding protein